ncbi:MAG: response regulator [Pseudomonadota bacterium]
MTNDAHEYTILFVDDEANILQTLKRLFRREPYKILTASSGQEGLKILAETPVDLLISDHRMPEMSGVEFMAEVKERFPNIMRIILTGYTGVSSITAAINEGQIYKFICKPWEDDQLKETVRDALEVHRLQTKNIALIKKIQEQNEELLRLNENLEVEIEKRLQENELQTYSLRLSHEILEHLSVGVVGLDPDNVIVLANRRACEMFEREGKLLLGSQGNIAFDREISDLIYKTAESAVPQEAVYTCKDGTTFMAKCAPLRAESKSRGLVLTFTEVK